MSTKSAGDGKISIADTSCAFDGRPCEVLEGVALDERALRMVGGYLPCSRCRGAELAASRLPGLRLGRHERELLLGAIADFRQVDGAPAMRRAARRLELAGLVELRHLRAKVQATHPRFWWAKQVERLRLHVRLTPLGAAVVNLVGEPLAGLKRIRWADVPSRALAAVRRPAGELCDDFRAGVAGLAEHYRKAPPGWVDPEERVAIEEISRSLIGEKP